MPKNHLPPQDPLDLLGIHIGRIDSALDQWMRKQGHSYASFAVLYMLGTAEGGICTQKQICDEWSLSKQTVFSICKGLMEKGLLELHESSRDRRERLLQLTPAGITHAEPLVRRARAFGQAVFQTFGQDRAARLLAEMDALSTVMETTLATENTPGDLS